MTDNLTCVQGTFYQDYFENSGKNIVYLLGEEVAVNSWKNEIDSNSSSYFDLPDDCWITKGESIVVGNWVEAYNNDDNISVEALLRKTVDWTDNSFIKFFAKDRVVFQARWCDFLKYWDKFIAVEEDYPIIVPDGFHREALVFRTIGDILKIG